MGCTVPALVAIVGPTGSGKSDLALRLAEEFRGEIVNCDSMQVYRGFDIGTAKTPPDERRGVPHHLIDIVEPDQTFTAGEYQVLGRKVLNEIGSRGRLPLVVGGTGFYLRALLDGLSAGPSADIELRARLIAREQRRPGSVHRLLTRLDPDAAAAIHPNDVKKALRALELRLLRNAPRQTLPARDPLTGFRVIKIGLDPPRTELVERLNRRLERMFARGLIEEVRGLLAAGVPPGAKPFESLGYKEVLESIRGELTTEQAVAAAQLATRQYAKRQMTWFRRESEVQWFAGFGSDPAVQDRVFTEISHLGNI